MEIQQEREALADFFIITLTLAIVSVIFTTWRYLGDCENITIPLY